MCGYLHTATALARGEDISPQSEDAARKRQGVLPALSILSGGACVLRPGLSPWVELTLLRRQYERGKEHMCAGGGILSKTYRVLNLSGPTN